MKNKNNKEEKLTKQKKIIGLVVTCYLINKRN